MFFTSDIINQAFSQLKEIDPSSGKSRKEKISGLRYLLAASSLLKKMNVTQLNMKVGSDLRNDFLSKVGNVVALDDNGLYTKDFNNEFDIKNDYGIGSNFYTTRLAVSRSRIVQYPGRPSPLLILKEENISLAVDVTDALVKHYNIVKIKTALCFWLMRKTDIDLTIAKPSEKEIHNEIDMFMKNEYSHEVYLALQLSIDDIKDFLSKLHSDYLNEAPYNTAEIINYSNESEILSEKNKRENILILNDDISEEDPILLITQKLLNKGAKGILFSGPPGTSKTWYALKIATRLTNSEKDRMEKIQFHPSYSYEDFIEGLVSSGTINNSEPMFKPKNKIFLNLCEKAQKDLDNLYILIIDEFSRGEPSKIFGELLTYIEPDYRDIDFILPYSERYFSIPQNIIIFATMNPYDRSVIELDSAMERRFEIIEMEPNQSILKGILEKNGFHGSKLGKLLLFFNKLNEFSPHGFGHTYFKNIESDDDLLLLWNHKLKFILTKMFKFDENNYSELKKIYIDILDDNKKENIK